MLTDSAAPATAAIADQLDAPDSRLKQSARQALADIGGAGAEAALVRDASRYADADLAEARRLRSVDGMEGVGEYLFDLPVARATPLAHRLLGEADPDSAFAGAWFLIYHGDVEPAIPALADSLARRDDGRLDAAFHAADVEPSGSLRRFDDEEPAAAMEAEAVRVLEDLPPPEPDLDTGIAPPLPVYRPAPVLEHRGRRHRDIGPLSPALLRVHVLADGTVGSLALLSGSGLRWLDRAVVEAVKAWGKDTGKL